jgi:hypothetical protein
MGPAVQRLIDGFKTQQAGRRARYIRNLELYEGRTLGGYSAHVYSSSPDAASDLVPDRLRLIRSSVATAVSSIYAPQKPKPQFQTLGATWATRRKAYRLDRICEGIINQRQGRWINVWALMADAGVDCALQGVACIKVTADMMAKKIDHQLIPHCNIFFDPSEGREPQNCFERGPISQAKALKLWPKAAKEIESAPAFDWYFKQSTSERHRAEKTIEICYAWRLPFGPDKPGRWCAVINGRVVDGGAGKVGDWTAPAFPFVFLLWEPHRDGPWASGIADEGARIAADAGDLDLRLYYRELVASGKKIWIPEGSINNAEAMDNDAVVGVVYTGGVAPTETVVPPFSDMEIDFKNSKVREFWDAIGISQQSAAARREQGIASGVAMLTLNDTKAGRQLAKAQRYEQSFVDLANQYVWRLRELGAENKNFYIRWPGKNLLRQQKWSEADVEDDSFNVSVAPSSALPHDPAGRQEMVSQLYSGGLISQDSAKSLIGWPDLDAELNMENAELDYVDMLIEKYLDAEAKTWSAADYEPPEGFIMNKMGALRRFTSAWFRARIDMQTLPAKERPAAEFSVALLRRYITELIPLMQPPIQNGPGPGMNNGPPGPDGLPVRGPGGPGALPPPMAAPPVAPMAA